MANADFYRGEAERCRELAATSLDFDTARRWRRLADEYAVLAEELQASEAGRVPLLRMPMQQQPIQQQQRKATER
jgi:hypothetical protein